MSEIKKPVILHLTSTISGGAGKYTMDFHRYLLQRGYESYMAVRGKDVIYPDGSKHTIIRSKSYRWNKLRRYFFRRVLRYTTIDMNYCMYNLCERFTCHSAADTLAAMLIKPNVVFVHWASDYANAEFIAELKKISGAEIIYLLVDNSLYSGGCHYQLDCPKYKDGCHDCPATDSRIVKRGIERNYEFKKRVLPQGIILLNSSDDRIRLSQSSIFKNFNIENVKLPMDWRKFIPSPNRDVLRQQWNIPVDKKVVFFGATSLDERRKGMTELIIALPKVHAKDVVFVAAGNIKNMTLPENTMAMGYLNEEQLIKMYQIADVFVCPSLADAGPMMVNQALMCGTPVVAFPVGVSADLVRTNETGYLAHYGDSNDLANGIDHVLSLPNNQWHHMSINCRKLAMDVYASSDESCNIETLISKLSNI